MLHDAGEHARLQEQEWQDKLAAQHQAAEQQLEEQKQRMAEAVNVRDRELLEHQSELTVMRRDIYETGCTVKELEAALQEKQFELGQMAEEVANKSKSWCTYVHWNIM